jgi:hypothetical protein
VKERGKIKNYEMFLMNTLHTKTNKETTKLLGLTPPRKE